MILLVEDQPLERKLVHDVLSSAGYTVRDAREADQAIAEIKRRPPELILIDMVLPGMDGLTLVKLLKADAATRNIPIVGVTSYPEKYTEAQAKSAGCEVFVIKPISTRELPRVMREVLEASRDEKE